MPELPEVQTVVDGLQDLVGQQLQKFIIRFPKLRYPLDKELLNKLKNKSVTRIYRRAKYIIIDFDGDYLLIHLGMSGVINILTNNRALKKHDHVDIVFDSITIRYNDPRRFGSITYTNNLITCNLTKNLGVEPLTNNFNAKDLHNKIKSRNTKIKQLIMDNAIVVGVGNIYACESLFISKISPLRLGCNVTIKECELLVTNIKEVLNKAIASGGSSLKDYQNAKGELGYFQHQHFVYGKSKQPCKMCNSIILEERIGQRNSFYCPSCQK